MDSTIATSETLDELAEHAGLKEEIAAITWRSMNGEIDFATALRERVISCQKPISARGRSIRARSTSSWASASSSSLALHCCRR